MATRTTRPAGIGKPSSAVVRDAGTLGVFTEPAAAAAAIRALNEGGHSARTTTETRGRAAVSSANADGALRSLACKKPPMGCDS